MKKFLVSMGSALTLSFCALTSSLAVEDYSATIAVFKSSPVVKPYFDSAYGFALFPTVGKGGLVVGGARGDGQVYRGGKVTGITTLTQISVGFQAGGQAFSQIIFFKDKSAYDRFTSGKFAFDASASAVAITAGAQAQASTSGTSAGVSVSPSSGKQLGATYEQGMATFVHTKGGFMYEAAIAGQRFNFRPL